MVEKKNENIKFLEAIQFLPLIRKQLMTYANDLIKNQISDKNEDKEIEKIITDILKDYNFSNTTIDDIDLLKNTLIILLKKQLEFSQMANKIRNLKSNTPSKFR